MRATIHRLIALLLAVVIYPTASSAAEGPEAFLGVSIAPLTPALRAQLDLKKDQGVLVAWVSPNSPASKAGLKQYDVLLEFDGVAVSTEKDVADAVSLATPNDQVNCWIIRAAKHDAIKITLGTRAPAAQSIKPGKGTPPPNIFGAVIDVPIFNLNFRAKGHPHATNFMLHDGTHLTQARQNKNGELELTVRDKFGKIVFKGPANTAEQRKKLPESVRKHLEENHLLP